MVQNFNFEVNIEKRMPQTGKVFMVDRMTSDYAKAHPFDVDEFILQVFEHWKELAALDESYIPRIRQFFDYGLGVMGEKFSTHCPAKYNDKIVKDPKTGIGQPVTGKWPEYVNGLEPALIEAWNKGAEYHTCGFRIGDTLPAKMPPHTITRLGDGEWICLFPKDMHLLEESSEIVAVEQEAESVEPDNLNIGLNNEDDSFGGASAYAHLPKTESEQKDAPVELDLFAQMQMEMQALREENERLKQCNMIQMRTAVRAARNDFDTENCPCETQGQSSPTRRQRRERRREQDVMALHTSPAITVSHDEDHSQRNMKIFAAVATAAVFLVLVNTVGLFGVAALGLLAGGLIK